MNHSFVFDDLPLTSFWHNKRVLVTGGSGFVGSHLVEALLMLGATVIACVRRVSRSQILHDYPNLRTCIRHPLLQVSPIDLAGPSSVRCLTQLEAEIWFHLAADAYVPASFVQQEAVILNNVMSTVNVLEAARQVRPDHVIIASSSEVYGSSDRAIKEDHALSPVTPYAASKASCDRIAWSYRQSFDMPITIVRPFNIYGPRHIYDVVPLFIRAALNNRPLTVHGDGNQTRDLTYVADAVAGYLSIGMLKGQGQVFNMGTGEDHAILHVAQVIKAAANSSSAIVFGPPRQGEVKKLQADSCFLQQTTGWKPKINFQDGVRLNIQWVREQKELQ